MARSQGSASPPHHRLVPGADADVSVVQHTRQHPPSAHPLTSPAELARNMTQMHTLSYEQTRQQSRHILHSRHSLLGSKLSNLGKTGMIHIGDSHFILLLRLLF